MDNSARGIWALTPLGQKTDTVDKAAVKKTVNAIVRVQHAADQSEVAQQLPDELAEDTWEDGLLETIRRVSPDAFERLCQRVLRESGFIHVEVTGRVGDGGIDGKGVVRVGGLLSFHVIFQCKRYQGSVSSSAVRDFRGAMVGRADKGLFITTGTFTKDARAEAQRDGAPPIDLIDGETLVAKLKELRLGVRVISKMIEQIEIDQAFFDGL